MSLHDLIIGVLLTALALVMIETLFFTLIKLTP